MGFTLVLGHRLGDNREDMELRRRRRSAEDTYPWGDTADEMEMRRRRRSEANNHWGGPEEEMEMRRMRRSAMDFGDDCVEMEMRRRRNEMGFDTRQNEMDEMRAEIHRLKKKVGELAGSGYASVKKLAPNLEGVLDDATKVIQNPPSTWPMYLQKHDYKGIAKMEGKELMAALESGKAPKDIRKELVHTVAALMLMAGS